MANIYWKSEGHKERMREAMQIKHSKIDKRGVMDNEYASALYILASEAFLWERSREYVSSSGLDITTLLKEVDFSGGYVVLIELAGNLFNSEQHVDPVELMRLDEQNFAVAIAAILIRRHGLRVSEVQ